MSNRSLPFYDDFFEIFEKYTIEKWEAKKFIEYILNSSNQTQKNRQHIYNGIHILVECRYLKRIVNPKKRNTYLYSELARLTDYRSAKKLEKIESVMNEKSIILSKNINSRNKELEFIHQIKIDHPDIASQLDKIEQNHIQDLNNLQTHKRMIDKIMQHFNLG